MSCASCNSAVDMACDHLCGVCATNWRVNNNYVCPCMTSHLYALFEEVLDELYEFHLRLEIMGEILE